MAIAEKRRGHVPPLLGGGKEIFVCYIQPLSLVQLDKEQSSGFSFLQKSLKNINVIKSYGGVNKTLFGHMSFTPHFCGVNVNVAVQSGIFTLCLRCAYTFSQHLPTSSVSLFWFVSNFTS